MKKFFDQKTLSSQWYIDWERKNYFSPDYKKSKTYCITLPPPNITGNLHMGHAFQATLMDILIRFYRMNNYCTLWKMGTDHAGIATQILIEQKIKELSIKTPRYEYAIKWKNKSNKNIKKQLTELCCSLNWKTNRFTLDKHFSYAVKTAFIKLYEDKLIYKAKKLVNWDAKIQTAISDLEVIHEEIDSEIFYIKYKIENTENSYITIATTRPETIFADVAIAINPDDRRHKNIISTHVIIPIINRIIPIIFNKNVNINFGTGCLKITPGHDFTDFEIGKEHNLPIINILNKDGTLNDLVPLNYRNLTIPEARKKIKKDLTNLNIIEKIEIQKNKIPKADRSNSIIEPLITEQWYIKTQTLAVPVYNAIKKNEIKIIPNKWKKIFFDWLNNIKDWCISRQIWWGHRIPIWYDNYNNEYIGQTKKQIIKKYKINEHTQLTQDENVLDTWFSSALWPFASLGWPNNTIEYKKLYPTTTLITGFDIIFFWAIKMMMFGLKFTNVMPFKEIYIHGLIRDHLGNKMSKTKGNVIDPLDIINGIDKDSLIKKQTSNLINEKMKNKVAEHTKHQFPNGIETFGADALRLTFCAIATDNISIKLDLEKVKNYKNFCTKLWNAAIFIEKTKSKNHIRIHQTSLIYNKYIVSIWQNVKKDIKTNIKRRKFNIVIDIIYKFFWTQFCNWHIELSKILIQNKKYIEQTTAINNTIFKEILKVLHPIAPYITEELWKSLNHNKITNIIVEKYPTCRKKLINKKIEKTILSIQNLCIKIRNIKAQTNKNNIIVTLKNITKSQLIKLEKTKKVLEKMTKIQKIKLTNNPNYNFDETENLNIIIN